VFGGRKIFPRGGVMLCNPTFSTLVGGGLGDISTPDEHEDIDQAD